MALISCPDCGASISDRAPACIKCGRPVASTDIAARIEAEQRRNYDSEGMRRDPSTRPCEVLENYRNHPEFPLLLVEHGDKCWDPLCRAWSKGESARRGSQSGKWTVPPL